MKEIPKNLLENLYRYVCVFEVINEHIPKEKIRKVIKETEQYLDEDERL